MHMHISFARIFQGTNDNAHCNTYPRWQLLRRLRIFFLTDFLVSMSTSMRVTGWVASIMVITLLTIVPQ